MMNKPLFPELFQVSEVELSYRNVVPYQERIRVLKASTAYEILRSSWDENKIDLIEQFKILLLDANNHCLGISNLTTGSINTCPLDPRILFVTALKAKATAIVLSHNHPSGSLTPSTNDIQTTEKIVKGGKLLDITVMDHIIIASHGYFSFGENKILPR